MRRTLAPTLALLALALVPASAAAHGGEEEALEQTPARALAQQALALLSQGGSPDEAHERVDAALESEDKAGVDDAKLGEAEGAFEREDYELAAQLLNEALSGETAPAPEGGGGEHDEMGAPDEAAAVDPELAPASFEHVEEFRPDRDTAEWIAAALGVLALGAAALLLFRGSRAGRSGSAGRISG